MVPCYPLLPTEIALFMSLQQQPFFERSVAEIEPIEQISAIERGGPLQLLRRALECQLLELRHIDRDAGSLQAQEIPVSKQGRRVHLSQRFSELEDSLLQAVPRMAVAAVAPE